MGLEGMNGIQVLSEERACMAKEHQAFLVKIVPNTRVHKLRHL